MKVGTRHLFSYLCYNYSVEVIIYLRDGYSILVACKNLILYKLCLISQCGSTYTINIWPKLSVVTYFLTCKNVVAFTFHAQRPSNQNNYYLKKYFWCLKLFHLNKQFFIYKTFYLVQLMRTTNFTKHEFLFIYFLSIFIR